MSASVPRHRESPPSARPRGRARGVALVAVLVAGLTAAGVVSYAGVRERGPRATTKAASTCQGPALHVVAAPEVAAVIDEIIGRVIHARGAATPDCPEVRVTARPPAEVVADLAGNVTSRRPDVWIPDSSYWTERLAAGGHSLAQGGTAPSLASSPVVVALRTTTADTLRRGTDRVLTYADLVPAGGEARLPARLRLAEPATSAPTVGAVLGLRAALAHRADAAAALAAELRAADRLPAVDVALSDPASSGGPDVTAEGVAVSEQAVWQHNRRHPGAAVTAAYPPAVAGTSLDYPYLVLASTARARAAAERLLQNLTGHGGRQAFGAAGFRAPDGAPGPELATVRGVAAQARVCATRAEAAALARAASTLDVVTRGSRLLVALDISGSMAARVPGAGGASRLDLALQAALTGLALYPDDTVAGLWVFSTNLDGSRDYRELVPLTPLGRTADGTSGRELLTSAIGRIRVQRNGGTGLYDTAVAAVRRVQTGWDAQRVNTVVILSDGANENPSGLTLAQAMKSLAAQQVPGRPVYLVTIGYGPDADPKTLEALSRATGAETYRALDPRDIRKVMLQAIGRRPDRPR